MTEQNEPVGAVVLCGGESRRMGRSKATLPFGPELMIQRVVRIIREVVKPCVVVAAADQQLPELPQDVLIAIDEQPRRGPLEGLYAGLRTFEGRVQAAYATGCDVPLLVPAFVQRMIEQLNQHDIVVPIDGKFHHPLAAVYRVAVVNKIKQLLDDDELRPRRLFDQVDTLRIPVSELREVDPELLTLINLNRPADYDAALSRAGFKR